jgi:hypothetical protein
VSIEISGKFSPILIAFKKADEIFYFDQSHLSYYESVKKTGIIVKKEKSK